MTSEVKQAIAAAGPRNAQLLATLAESDYAPAALQQQRRLIADIEHSIKQQVASIKKLEASTQKELKDHEKYRDSTVKRLAYKLGGKKEKFDEKASKEEREYFEAVVAQKAAEDQRAMLEAQLKDAERAKHDFEREAEVHKQAQEELEELYNGIFAGPTPDFPEEDAKEFPVYDAEKKLGDLQTKSRAAGQALASLTEAQGFMQVALASIDEALSWSTYDIFGGGGFADYAERNAISKASSAAATSTALVAQASRMDKRVTPIGPIEIANKNIISDILFDNIFTDLNFHEKIKQSAANLRQAAVRLEQQRSSAADRQQQLRSQVQNAETQLKDARSALQKVRQDAFEKVEASQPPPYVEA